MPTKTFETTVQSGERGRIFIPIPFDPAEAWGRKGRHYVSGTLNETPFQGSLGSRGGAYFFPLNKALQQAAGLRPGDPVRVTIDTAEATADEVPDDLRRALADDPGAKAFFDGLSPFYRNEYVGWITSAKREETRKLRLAEALSLLRAGRKQR